MTRKQCKDIPDELFLEAVTSTISCAGDLNPYEWRMRWNVQETLEGKLGWSIPEKLYLAKAKKLITAKKLAGCECGCRGDYHIPCNRWGCCVTPDWEEDDEPEYIETPIMNELGDVIGTLRQRLNEPSEEN